MIWSDVISPDSIPKGSLQSKSESGGGTNETERRQKKRVKGEKVRYVELNPEQPEYSQNALSASLRIRANL